MRPTALQLFLLLVCPTVLLAGSAHWEQILTEIISARAAGDYDLAIRLSEEALSESKFENEERFYFVSLSQLGSSYQMNGELEKAEAIFTRALEEKEKRFGPDHPTVASSLYHLGQLQLRLGNREHAEALFNRASGISLQHPESGRMLESLAFSLRDRDRIAAMEKRYLYELEVYELELGPTHPELLRVLDNLGLLYKFQGRYDEAISMFGRMLEIQIGEFGENSSATRKCIDQLLTCYRAVGKERGSGGFGCPVPGFCGYGLKFFRVALSELQR